MERSALLQGEHVEPIPAAEALEALIEAYGKLVFHLIYGMTRNWEESQDLTQETFLQALQAIDAARAASNMHFHAKAWLVRIAINTVRMHQRRQRILRFVPFSQFEGEQTDAEDLDTPCWLGAAAPVQPAGCGASGGENPAEVIAERDAVARTMAKLPESLRLPLLLSIVAGLSLSEMARLLDLRETAVRQRLSRARRAFQSLYAYESGEMINIGGPEWRSQMVVSPSQRTGVYPLLRAPAMAS
jgi:RNA polymerase sigma-70 factor (ECF subfamily)